MTIETYTDRLMDLSPAPGSTELVYEFRLTAAAAIRVIRHREGVATLLDLGTDYYFPAGLGDGEGGSLTLSAPTLEDDRYILVGLHPEVRLSDFNASKAFSSDKFNGDLDLLTMLAQEHRRDINRAWKSEYGTEGRTVAVLPDGHFHKSDADGNLIDGGSSADIEHAQENAEATKQDREAAEAARDIAIEYAGSVQFPLSYGVSQSLSTSQRLQAQDNISLARVTRINSRDSGESVNLSGWDAVYVNRWSNASPLSPAMYAPTVSEPAHDAKFQDALGNWFERVIGDKPATPEDFGAVADGTNQFSNLAALFSFAAATGAIIDGNGKTYTTTAQIDLPIAHFNMRNIKLDGTGIPTNNGNSYLMRLNVPDPAAIGDMVNDVPEGAISFDLTSTAGLSADDYILIRTDAFWSERENDIVDRNARGAEFKKVKSVVGSTVTLWEKLEAGYLVSDNARVEKVNGSGSLDLEDVTFIGCENGLIVNEGLGSTYYNVRAFNQSYVGVGEARCYLTTADRWRFEGKGTAAPLGDSMYGLTFTGCFNCQYGDVFARRTRHAVVGGSVARGRTVSRGCQVGDILATECYSAAIDQHAGCGPTTYGNLIATAANGVTGAAVDIEGAGGYIASVKSSGFSTSGVRFGSFGFGDPGFEPTLTIGHLDSRDAYPFVIDNSTNRYGTFRPQKMNIIIQSIKSRTMNGPTGLCRSGDCEIHVGPGEIDILWTGSNTNGFIVTSTAIAKARLTLDRTRIKAKESRCLDLNGTPYNTAFGAPGVEAIFIGGEVYADPGTFGIRSQNAALKLVGTVENGLNISGSNITRASFA